MQRRTPIAVSLALLCVLLSPAGAVAQSSYRVELITIGPGDELWNAFGHTALRVIDEQTGRDEIYNYGVANFGDPAFIWGFLRGRSTFRLAVLPWWETVISSVDDDRTLVRQVLNLTDQQADELATFLEWNARPDNAEYFYDHLLDNCSTRVRDAVDQVVDGRLREAVADWAVRWTYRDLTLAAGAGRFHFSLGLDLASGPNQSVLVDGWASMYLPEYLMRGAAATMADEWRGLPLAQAPVVVYERRGPPAAHGHPHAHRFIVVAAGLLLAVGFVGLGRRERRGWGSRWGRGLAVRGLGAALTLLALVFGLLGTVYLVLGIVSIVPDTHWNENTWLFWPFDVLLLAPGARALFTGRWRMGRWLRRYLVLRVALLAGYALLKPTGLFPQDNWAFLGTVAALFVGLRLSPRESVPARVEREASAAAEDAPSGQPRGHDMTAIIIGAGRGRRLMPYTNEQPKCFAELGGQRILDWVVEALRAGGLDEIVFVGGYRIDDVRQNYPELALRHNDAWADNNILASLFYAEDAMAGGFVSSYSDIVFAPEAVEALLQHPGDIVLAVDTAWRERYQQRSEHPESDAEKVIAQDDRVTRISRDVPSEQAVGEFIGVAKFSERGARLLRLHYHGLRAELGDEPFRGSPSLRKAYLIEMLQELIERGADLRIAPISGGYYEIDTTEDYAIAQREWPAVAVRRFGRPGDP